MFKTRWNKMRILRLRYPLPPNSYFTSFPFTSILQWYLRLLIGWTTYPPYYPLNPFLHCPLLFQKGERDGKWQCIHYSRPGEIIVRFIFLLFLLYSLHLMNWSHSIQSTSSQYRFIRTFHNWLCNISNWIRSVRSRKKSFTFYKWYNGYYLIHTSQKYEISIRGVSKNATFFILNISKMVCSN